MFTSLYVMYRGNLSLHTFFLTFFFFIRKFLNFQICSNLVGFNRIKSIVILLKDRNQLRKKWHYDLTLSTNILHLSTNDLLSNSKTKRSLVQLLLVPLRDLAVKGC